MEFYGIGCLLVVGALMYGTHKLEMKLVSRWILCLFIAFIWLYSPFFVTCSRDSGGGASSTAVDVGAGSGADGSFSDVSVDPGAASSGGSSGIEVQKIEKPSVDVLSWLQYSLRSMTLGVNLNDIRKEMADSTKEYGRFYRYLLNTALFIAPFVTTTWLLSFFSGAYEWLNHWLWIGKTEHIFPEADAPSLSLAEQIPVKSWRFSFRGECVLFCQQARREGKLANHSRWHITSKSTQNCGHPIWAAERRYYFLSDDTEKNENRAMELLAHLNRQGEGMKERKTKTIFFVRTDNELASRMMESSAADLKNSVVACYLDTDRMLCYELLKEHSELLLKRDDKTTREQDVIIYGDHPIAGELLKLYLWTSGSRIFYYTEHEPPKSSAIVSGFADSRRWGAEDIARKEKMFGLKVKERVSLREVLQAYEDGEREFILHLCPKSDHQATAYLNEAGKLMKDGQKGKVTCCFEGDTCMEQAQRYFTSEERRAGIDFKCFGAISEFEWDTCIEQVQRYFSLEEQSEGIDFKCYGAISERFSRKLMEEALQNWQEGKKIMEKKGLNSLSVQNRGMAVRYEREFLLEGQDREKCEEMRIQYEYLYDATEGM